MERVHFLTASERLNVQFPFGFSPQVLTDMNGQALNPVEEMSFLRGIKRSVVVPADVKQKIYINTYN
jgi:hypothetical protein